MEACLLDVRFWGNSGHREPENFQGPEEGCVPTLAGSRSHRPPPTETAPCGRQTSRDREPRDRKKLLE
jgi:hypothetical protein